MLHHHLESKKYRKNVNDLFINLLSTPNIKAILEELRLTQWVGLADTGTKRNFNVKNSPFSGSHAVLP